MKKILVLFLCLITTNTFAATKKAIFAGGCFWCMEPPYEKLEGVASAVSGYTGGRVVDPTYEAVSSGKSGHVEVVEITYDDSKVSYEKLLEVFWKNVDPFDKRGQFCDKGEQYTNGIYYSDEKEKMIIEKSLKQMKEKFKGKEIVTFVKKAGVFYPAEEYHQDYYKKNPVRYKFYRYNCGRDKRLEEVWGK